MLPVVLSLLALGLGPLVGPLLVRHRHVASAFDGFVIVTVCGLVVLHVLPQSVGLGGTSALLWAAIGAAVPALLHRLDARQQSAAVRGSRDVVTTVVFVGAAFAHALLDGTALVGHSDLSELGHEHVEEGASFSVLAVAVLLHRIPYGLALWLVGRERLGLPRTLMVLVALAAGTVVGASVGEHLVTTQTAAGFALVQAFAAGAILHVLLDAPPVDISGAPRWSILGVFAGIAVLVALAQTHPFLVAVTGELDFGGTLQALVLRLAPGLALGLVVAALMSQLPSRLRVHRHRFDVVAAGSGVVAGALRGLCTCTVVPLYDAIVRRRASVAAATAFLIGAPELSAPSVFVTAGLVGGVFAVVRVVAAVVLAVTVGVFVGAAANNVGADADDGSGSIDVASRAGFVKSLLSIVDHTAPWLVLGCLAAAFVEPLLSPSMLASIPKALEVPLYAIAGVPFYVCGTGAAPLAAVLLHKGASAGAVTALLLTAPATNLATLGLLSRLLSRRAAVVFGVFVFGFACVAGVVVNALSPDLASPSLHAMAASEGSVAFSVVEVACAAFLAVLVSFSVARQGARGFLGQIIDALDDAKGGHVHGPHCGHAEHRQPGFLKKAPVTSVKLDFVP